VEEDSLFVDEMPIEMPIATKDSENRPNEESELDDSVYVSRAAAGDERLKDAQIFEGAASCQISGDENSPVDGILVEMQGDNGKHYIIRRTVTVKRSQMRASQDIEDERSHRTVWISEAATHESHARKMQARLYINVDRG
jgi:hypothetical protein